MHAPAPRQEGARHQIHGGVSLLHYRIAHTLAAPAGAPGSNERGRNAPQNPTGAAAWHTRRSGPALPLMNPEIVVWLRKLVIQPRRSRPTAVYMRPATNATCGGRAGPTRLSQQQAHALPRAHKHNCRATPPPRQHARCSAPPFVPPPSSLPASPCPKGRENGWPPPCHVACPSLPIQS